MEKRYEDLRFTDDFLFCKILTDDPELCKELAELVLGRKINRIISPMTQKPIKMTDDGKGVRLDVFFEDDLNTVYDIEMQTADKKDLAKRSRYYQGMIDLDLLKKGSPYKELKDSYIVFLCTFDPFGERLHRYTFTPACQEKPSLTLADGSTRVFINTEGIEGEISPELKSLLNYMNGANAETDFTRRIDRAVQDAQDEALWRKEYMMLSMIFQEKIEEGLEKGRKEGRKEGREEEKEHISLLIKDLIDTERFKDFQDFFSDNESWKKIIEELGLTSNLSKPSES